MKNLIVITGGTKGIGRAIAFKFASEGWDVVNCSSNPENLNTFKKEFQTLFPNQRLFAFQADLSKPEQVKGFCKEVLNINRPIQALVNNAGIFLPGSVLEEEDGVLEFQLALNVQCAYYVSRAIIPTMIKNGEGSVFTICSTASIMPYINGGSYCISKYALLGMTKVLREELKNKKIKVTAVIPGATLTNSWEGTDLPESRFIKPEDIADAVFATYSLSGNTVVEEILIRPQEGDL